MTFEPNGLGRIREAFAPLPGDPPLNHECPTSETIWDAANGKLRGEQVRALALHATRCSACASAWRMANEARAIAGIAVPSTRVPAVRSYRTWGLAAALVVGALAAGLFLMRRDDSTPVERTDSQAPLESALAEPARLSRTEFTLRWRNAGSGALYRIEVAKQSLDSVYSAAGLTTTQVTVPAESLRSVGTGEVLYWKVTAALPDGRVVEGTTHTVTLE